MPFELREAYRLQLEIKNQLPNSLNKSLRSHHLKRHRQNILWDLLVARGIDPEDMPPKPLTRAKITLIRHSWRTLDYDGLVGSMKPVVDALVTAGILVDDSWKVLGQWYVNQVFRPKKDGTLLQVQIDELVDNENQ